MTSSHRARTLVTAMLCSAAVSAEFIGGKATRDSLFLTSVGVTALPTMLIAAAACSMLLVAAQARWAGKIAPAVLVPASFVGSGVLFLCEWFLRASAPGATAIVVYLHVSGAGPLLASGFWLIASERFDPHTAKRRFGQIAGAGTFGGLLGAVLSERVAALLGVPAMLLFLGALQFVSAWLVWRLSASAQPSVQAAAGEGQGDAIAPRLLTSLQVIAGAPHLRHLMALVVLGTTSAALLEYLFKAGAVEAFGSGDRLLRFFALYYGATTLITFILQLLSARVGLERFGLAMMASTPSIAMLAGSIGALAAPGLGGVMVARAGESIFRASWFRAAYELFYTPIPAREKRAAKPLSDVALARMGDAVGGGLVRLAMVFVPLAQSPTILSAAIVCSIGAVVAASHLNRWHIRSLENSLVRRGGRVDVQPTSGGVTARLLLSMRTKTLPETHRAQNGVAMTQAAADPIVQDILSLRSSNRRLIVSVLSREEGMAAPLVPHAIPLLESDALAEYAFSALRKVADARVGELADALLDQNQDYVVRRRLARVFSTCGSQRAADALLLALDDPRFEVRFQSARSLATILERNPQIRVGRERVEEVVLREIAASRPIWEGGRLLEGVASDSPLDEFVKGRAGQSLAHVFTLLSLVLPRQPLQIAFQSLRSDDRQLRGTALEYLEGVLPAQIRQQLWPFLRRRRGAPNAEPHEAILANLLRSNPSVTLLDFAKQAGKPLVAGFEAV
jgi:hypothetical protein